VEAQATPAAAPVTLSSPGGAGPGRAVRIVHLFPAVLVAALTTGLVALADRDAPVALYVQLGLGMLFYQFAIGVANDVMDTEADATAKPWKPIPSGLVSLRTARLLAAGFVAAGLIVTAGLDFVPWVIGIGGLACGLIYDGALKRTAWSWLPWAIAFPLIPAWVYTAADAWEPLLWWAFPLGGSFAIALHFANQSPDAAADSSLGVRGLPQRLGARRSARLSLALFGLAASGAAVVLLFEAPQRAGFVAAAGTIALLLAPRAALFFGRDGLFGLLSASAAIVSIFFLSAV